MIAIAAEVARRRPDRGLKPNYPKAVAIMNAELLEGARDGGSVADLMSFGATIFPRGRDGGRRRDGGRGRAVGTTFPDDTKLITVHDPSSRAPWYVVGRPVRRQVNLVLCFLLEPCVGGRRPWASKRLRAAVEATAQRPESLFAYTVEEGGDLRIVYVCQQEVVGHQVSQHRVLPALLVRAGILWVALREPPHVLQKPVPVHAPPS